jgi:hypothetical protein
MATSKIRSSAQLHIDANLDFNSNKGVNLAAGVANTDAANVGQMNTAITNALSGLSGSLHTPVANLAAAKAVPAGERADKMLMNIEDMGLYRYDLESVAVSNDATIIRPTDIASDATAGRWVKMSSSLSDHNNLSSIQGGGVGDYQHLTSAQVTKLNNIEALADVTDADNVGAVMNAATAKGTPVDADTVPISDSAAAGAIKKITFTVLKSFLKSYFDTLYNMYVHPTHTGEVTGSAALTITAGAVTNAKLAQVPTQTFHGRNTAGTGDVENLTVAQVKTMLGLDGAAYQKARVFRAAPTGAVNGSNAAFTIASNMVSGSEEVFKNGILMNAGAGNDYTISYGATTTITFLTAPSALGGYTDVIIVNYTPA